MAKIELKNVCKYFEDKKSNTATAVLYNVNAVFEDGKFNVILGESGCGKTMLLKSIAGLLSIDEGEIFFNDIDYTNVIAGKRNLSLLTQEYALYPHITVFDNVAYPLKIAKVPNDEIKRRVNEVLSLLNISLLSSRRPRQLSGGQQQRVAIARALVKNPDIILFDEPLSNVDPLLRHELIEEFLRLQRMLSITFIYVTHNISEATALADNIIIMHNGEIKCSGTKNELMKDKESYFYKNFVEVE